MATELGYEGGKSIFDDYVGEVTVSETAHVPAHDLSAGELVQCDLWEPRALVPVGHGQARRVYL